MVCLTAVNWKSRGVTFIYMKRCIAGVRQNDLLELLYFLYNSFLLILLVNLPVLTLQHHMFIAGVVKGWYLILLYLCPPSCLSMIA